MKNVIFFAMLSMIAGSLYAQKLELNVYAGTGLYNYTGNNSNTSSSFNLNYDGKTGYINDPYGRKLTFSYEAGLQAKWVTSSNILLGAKAGYQLLRSRTDINTFYDSRVVYYTGAYTVNMQNNKVSIGNGVLSNQYINLSPYVGYRFHLGNISLDAMPGISFGLPVYSSEKVKAVSSYDNQTYSISQKQDGQKSDTRLTMSLAFNFKRWGIDAAYSHGITNYLRGSTAAYYIYSGQQIDSKVYSQYISAGVYYRLK